jgi:putative tryptophan/tyrosine transport system substrate-binding protein
MIRGMRALAVILAVLAVPLSVRAGAPPGKTVRLGVIAAISPRFDPADNPSHRALVEGLREHGYEVGRNVILDFRSAAGNPEQVTAVTTEAVAARPDILVTYATAMTLEARKLTTTIPVVMVGAQDPVTTGVVASLTRPGGNITGIAANSSEIAAKRVQLLQEAVPRLARVAVLWNTTLKSMALGFQKIETAAPSLGITIESIRVAGPGDFERAFAAIGASKAGGLIVLYGPMRGDDLPRIVDFVTRQRLPTVFELGQGVKGGGLMEFGPDFADAARRAGGYVDKLVNGARPGDLPIEEPTKFELVLNLKAARTLGLALPPSLLMRADRTFE